MFLSPTQKNIENTHLRTAATFPLGGFLLQPRVCLLCIVLRTYILASRHTLANHRISSWILFQAYAFDNIIYSIYIIYILYIKSSYHSSCWQLVAMLAKELCDLWAYSFFSSNNLICHLGLKTHDIWDESSCRRSTVLRLWPCTKNKNSGPLAIYQSHSQSLYVNYWAIWYHMIINTNQSTICIYLLWKNWAHVLLSGGSRSVRHLAPSSSPTFTNHGMGM